MSHPLDDVKDSNWGREQERRHLENISRFTRVDTKLEALDDHIAEDVRLHREADVKMARLDERVVRSEEDRLSLRVRLDEIKKDIDSIKQNTATMIAIARAGAALKRFLIWALPLFASAITAYVTWTLKK